MILGFGNNVKGSLGQDITANQTTIRVMPGLGALFATTLVPSNEISGNPSAPNGLFAKLTISDTQETVFEIVHLVSVAGDVLTVVRGQEGTAKKSWSFNDNIANFATKGSETRFVQVEELQNGKYQSCTATGTANGLVASIAGTFNDRGVNTVKLPTPLYIIPTASNTGAATLTLTLSGITEPTKPLVKGNNAALNAGDIIVGVPILVIAHSSWNFYQVINPATAPLDTVAGDNRYLKIANNLSEIKANGSAAQRSAQVNLDLPATYLQTANDLSEIKNKGVVHQSIARDNIGIIPATLNDVGITQLTDLSNPNDVGRVDIALVPLALQKATEGIAPLTVPVGGAMLWFSVVPPDGWLEANGQTFNKTDNPKLALVYPSGRVPDCRGYAIRGWDHGAGIDSDKNRSIGSIQQDAMRNITGTFLVDVAATENIGVAVTGAFYDSSGGGLQSDNGSNWRDEVRKIHFDASRVVPTATENRVKNIAAMIIIKTDKVEASAGTTSPTGIIVSPDNQVINAGTTKQFSATVLPASLAPTFPVTWTVADATLGSISSSGLYTAAAGKTGTQTIIASVSSGLSDVATITQYVYATALSLAAIPGMKTGETYTPVLTRTPTGATEPLVYSSADTDVAVFINGVVTAQDAGTTTVTAKGQYSGITTSKSVTVTAVVVPETYLKIVNNLSEIAANGTAAQQLARGNLGLGTASKENIQTSIRDRVNKVAIPGQFGYGAIFNGSDVINFSAANDFNLNFNGSTPPGCYLVSATAAGSPIPSITFVGQIEICNLDAGTNPMKIAIFTGVNGDMYFNRWNSTYWVGWYEIVTAKSINKFLLSGLNTVGSYGLMGWNNTSTQPPSSESGPGLVTAGSNLRFVGTTVTFGNPVPLGTWMCMGAATNATDRTLWQRIL